MPRLNVDLLERIIASTRAKAVQAVKTGKRVIVIGARPTNLPDHVLDNPLVECWYDNRVANRLPDTAGLVLHTRFVSHQDLERLSAQAYRRGVDWHNVPFTTGHLREILLPLVPSLTVQSAVPVAAPVIAADILRPSVYGKDPHMSPEVSSNTNGAEAPSFVKRGALKAFVVKHSNLASPVAQEAARLLALARTSPDVSMTTDQSIKNLLYALRHDARHPKPSAVKVANGRKGGLAKARNARRKAQQTTAIEAPSAIRQMANDAKAAIDLIVEQFDALQRQHAHVTTTQQKIAAVMATLAVQE